MRLLWVSGSEMGEEAIFWLMDTWKQSAADLCSCAWLLFTSCPWLPGGAGWTAAPHRCIPLRSHLLLRPCFEGLSQLHIYETELFQKGGVGGWGGSHSPSLSFSSIYSLQAMKVWELLLWWFSLTAESGVIPGLPASTWSGCVIYPQPDNDIVWAAKTPPPDAPLTKLSMLARPRRAKDELRVLEVWLQIKSKDGVCNVNKDRM